MTEPIWASMAGSRRAGSVGGIGAVALADLLGRWPAAEGPLYRLLAARIARLADTGELPAGLQSRQGAGTRIVPRRTTPAAVHRANGFFAGLLETSLLDADLSLAAVDCAPQVATALADPGTVLRGSEAVALAQASGRARI